MATANDAQEQEIRLKLIVVGKKFVGKTAVVQRYVQGNFKANDKATIGVDFFMKELHPRRVGADGKLPKLTKNQAYHSEINNRVLLHIWDIAGQDTYIDQLSSMFCRGAIGAVLICDVTSPESFDALRILKREIDRMVHIPDLEGEDVTVPSILVVNKYDEVSGKNPNQKPAFTKEQVNQFAEELEVNDWFYTSAKSGDNVDNCFDAIVTNIFADRRITQNPHFAPKEGFSAKKKKPVKKQNSGCPCQN